MLLQRTSYLACNQLKLRAREIDLDIFRKKGRLLEDCSSRIKHT